MPSTTAGAWREGVAWKAWAVIVRPMYSRIAIPASMGINREANPNRPKQQAAASTTPFIQE